MTAGLAKLAVVAAVSAAAAAVVTSQMTAPIAPALVDAQAPPTFEMPELLEPVALEGAASQGAEVDTSYLWAAFEAGDYRSVRQEVKVMQRLHPGWVPPEDLLRLTDALESRGIVAQAVTAEAHQEAIDYYLAHPERFRCADITIEALWLVAEAFVRVERGADAFGVYNRVLLECDATDLRLATLEKAIALGDRPRFAALIAVEDERAHEAAELERLARIRRDGLGGPEQPKQPVQLSKADRILRAVGNSRASADQVAWLEQHARTNRSANAAMVLGYNALNGGSSQRAVIWFRQSLEWRSSPKAAEGLYYALGKLGQRQEQERLQAAYPKTLDPIARRQQQSGGTSRLASAWRALEQGDAEKALLYADVAGADASDRDLLRGWALMESNRPTQAKAAFDRAAQQQGSGEAKASAAKGQALALIATGRADQVEIDEAMPAEDVAQIKLSMINRDINQAFKRRQYYKALQIIEERNRKYPQAAPAGAVEGWVYYELRKYNQARKIFARLYRQNQSAEMRKAMRIVDQRIYPDR